MVDYFKKLIDLSLSQDEVVMEESNEPTIDILTSLSENPNLTMSQTEYLLSGYGYTEADGDVFLPILREGQHYVDFRYSQFNWGKPTGLREISKAARLTLRNILHKGKIPDWMFRQLYPEKPTEAHIWTKLHPRLFGDTGKYLIAEITQNPNLSSEQIDYFLSFPPTTMKLLEVEGVLSNIARYSRLTDKQFEFLIDSEYIKNTDGINTATQRLAKNSQLTYGQTERLLNDATTLSWQSLVSKQHFTNEQFNHIITTTPYYYPLLVGKELPRIYRRLTRNPNLTPEQSQKVLDYYGVDDFSTREFRWIIRRQHLPIPLFLTLMRKKSDALYQYLQVNPNLTKNQSISLFTKATRQFQILKERKSHNSCIPDPDEIAIHTNLQHSESFFNRLLKSPLIYKSWLAANPTLNPNPREFALGIFNWMW